MTIKIFSNAKGLQNNNYNMIRLCKLGNITDYIYIYIFFYEISIGVLIPPPLPPVLLTKLYYIIYFASKIGYFDKKPDSFVIFLNEIIVTIDNSYPNKNTKSNTSIPFLGVLVATT